MKEKNQVNISTPSSSPYYLHVYAKPKSNQNKIGNWMLQGKYVLTIYITSPPENGKANKAIVTLLAHTFGIAQNRIFLVNGLHSRYKTFKIEPWSSRLTEKLPELPLLPVLF